MPDNKNGETRTLRFFSLTKLHYDSQGRVRTFTPTMAREWWEPFYEHFSNVVIHARVRPNFVEDRGYLVDHPHLSIVPLPYYEGVSEYLLRSAKIRKFISQCIISPHDYYGLWVPSQLSGPVTKRANKLGAPILAIVIGDGAAVAKAIAPSPFKTVLAKLSASRGRKAVSRAGGVIYVTLKALQRRYPARPTAVTLARTNVQLSLQSLEPPTRTDATCSGSGLTSVVTVGSQEQNYKGHDLLIDGVAKLQGQGYALALTVIGDGRLHDDLVRQATVLGIKNVTFHKRVGDSLEVAREVANHDFFVMPSRTEGMPKALLEAMSVGTFALGAAVGGIPEVLDAECLFEPESSDALVETLGAFVDHPERIARLAGLQREVIRDIAMNHAGPEVLSRFLGSWLQRSDVQLLGGISTGRDKFGRGGPRGTQKLPSARLSCFERKPAGNR